MLDNFHFSRVYFRSENLFIRSVPPSFRIKAPAYESKEFFRSASSSCTFAPLARRLGRGAKEPASPLRFKILSLSSAGAFIRLSGGGVAPGSFFLHSWNSLRSNNQACKKKKPFARILLCGACRSLRSLLASASSPVAPRFARRARTYSRRCSVASLGAGARKARSVPALRFLAAPTHCSLRSLAAGCRPPYSLASLARWSLAPLAPAPLASLAPHTPPAHPFWGGLGILADLCAFSPLTPAGVRNPNNRKKHIILSEKNL